MGRGAVEMGMGPPMSLFICPSSGEQHWTARFPHLHDPSLERVRSGGWRNKSMEPSEYEAVMTERILLQNAAVGREQPLTKLSTGYFRVVDRVETRDSVGLESARNRLDHELKSFRSHIKHLKMLVDLGRLDEKRCKTREETTRLELHSLREEVASLAVDVSKAQSQHRELAEYEDLRKSCIEMPQVEDSATQIRNLQQEELSLHEEDAVLKSDEEYYQARFSSLLKNIKSLEDELSQICCRK